MKRVHRLVSGAVIGLAALALSPLPGVSEAFAHATQEHLAAGEPGDPKIRVVKVTMLESGKKMLFEPAVVQVRLGEQVRF